MIDIEYLKSFYPPYISGNPSMQKNILKEYIELLVLDYLSPPPILEIYLINIYSDQYGFNTE